MRKGLLLGAALALGAAASAQDRPASQGPFQDARFDTSYIRIGLRDGDALLYRPTGAQSHGVIALVYTHPSGNTFTEPLGPQMAARGYRVLMVDVHGQNGDDDRAYFAAISQTIRYARSLPGVAKVVLVGHSGGGHLAAFYENVAEHGPAACNGADKLYPCGTALTSGLEKPDGLVLLDPTLGAFHQANALDPASGVGARAVALDMFAPVNGYDRASAKARYAPAFIARFDAAQAARSMAITRLALGRIKAVEAGKSHWRDDEPLVIEGMGNLSAGTRLFQPDTSLLAHTHGAYRTLMADGSEKQGAIVSVRPPLGRETPAGLGTLELMTHVTTARRYLLSSAIRFAPDFALKEDGINGVDWASAMTSTPGNARGITVPTLVLTMTCHYLVVPDEIVFNNLAAADKTLMGIEGAQHVFTPCRPEYGDTVKRTFDAVGGWLGKEGRF